MKQPDIIRIQHMVDAVEEIVSFIQGKTIDDVFKDRQLTLALIKLIEIIGEAASKISKETQLEFNHVPWVEIIGMRNRLIHVYFDVDIERVWDTVQMDIPELGKNLETILNTMNNT